jgi:hypothetical protein
MSSPVQNPNQIPFLQDVTDVLKFAQNDRTNIINKVFSLLILLTQTLQKTAAAQSDRLNLYTSWQKAYTAIQNQVVAFTANNPAYNAVITGSDTNAQNARDDLNKANAAYTQEEQGRSGVVSDDAKALQTNVQQSSDAVNQQTNMATSLLQTLSTLLGSIFNSSG